MARGVGFVENQANESVLDDGPGEFLGLLAETLYRSIRMNGFRGIDADEPHFFVGLRRLCRRR